MKRRRLLKAGVVAGALPMVARAGRPAVTAPAQFCDSIHALEQKFGGQLGVAAIDTGSQRLLVHRGNERFLLCSTFKVTAASMILQRVDEGREALNRRIIFAR